LTAIGLTSGSTAQTAFKDARNWNLTFAGTGTGSVTITPSTGTVTAPVSCGGTGTNAPSQTVSRACSPNITISANDSVITLSANPNSGSAFGGWSAAAGLSSWNCSGTTNPCSAVIGGGAGLTVTFNALSATGLTVSPASGTYGGTVSLTATLTRSSNGAAISAKTITFTLNGINVGSATTTASGIANLSNVSVVGINAGTYLGGVGASFAGDSGFASSNGTAILTIAKASTVTTVSCGAGPFTYNGSAHTPCSASVTGPGLSQSLTVKHEQHQCRHRNRQCFLRRDRQLHGQQRHRNFHHRQGEPGD
jgi:Bacterial Ig-like domain (group 3)